MRVEDNKKLKPYLMSRTLEQYIDFGFYDLQECVYKVAHRLHVLLCEDEDIDPEQKKQIEDALKLLGRFERVLKDRKEGNVAVME